MAIKLSRVTFTGADDSVRGVELRAFMQRANLPSFIEWGILVSESQEGGKRFPTAERIEEFIEDLEGVHCFLSLHVCGKWVRQICNGDWSGLVRHYGMGVINKFDRIQLNFHADRHALRPQKFFDEMKRMQKALGFDLILQFDGVNDHLLKQCHENGINAFPLFDLSGGKGELPESWDAGVHPYFNGYAGGLGPENVEEELPKIVAAAGTGEFWIDMETRIRSHADHQFDLAKCRQVMEGIDRHFKSMLPAFVH